MRVINEPKVIPKLKNFIGGVKRYPVTAADLADKAQDEGVIEVSSFYKAFPPDALFPDEEDLLARSEQVGLLNSEDQPVEEFHAPEED